MQTEAFIDQIVGGRAVDAHETATSVLHVNASLLRSNAMSREAFDRAGYACESIANQPNGQSIICKFLLNTDFNPGLLQ